jgi:two-component system response regulator RegX3
MGGIRLLLVEDDDAIVRPLLSSLQREGFSVARFDSAEPAIEALRSGRPEDRPALVIMDIALPGMSGLEACRIIRVRWGIPAIMLTARADPGDRIAGLEIGAEDYVPKPFSARELVARIRAVLRRLGWQAEEQTNRRRPDPPILVGDLEIEPARREVRAPGRTIALTPREFDLLLYLASRSPAAVPRGELMREVWDAHWYGPTQTLDVHVAQIRRKVEPDPRRPRYLHTVRGLGYQVRDAWPSD